MLRSNGCRGGTTWISSRVALATRGNLTQARNNQLHAPDALVAEALELISRKISALLVVEAGEVVGIIHFHDLLGVGAA